jgi:hypothetical protein
MPDATAAIITTVSDPVPARYSLADSRRLFMYSSGYSLRKRIFRSMSPSPFWALAVPTVPDTTNIVHQIRKVKA